ncbi:MAG TPA: ribulokinase [Opitutaceae bacterium]|nr:ribulokinase [Opitutaceae bacterium]
MAFTLGIDFGTNSARALIVRCGDGAELGSCVAQFRSGRQGVLLDPGDAHLARQYPGDYLVALEESVRGALAAARRARGFSPGRIAGVGVDTTGSSPIPVDRRNRPLALDRRWRRNLAAQCWLWKDHTSWREAARITEAAARTRPAYIAKCGNRYSSEWFWSKIWHCLCVAPGVFNAAYSWVELADWIPSTLAGVTDPLRVVRGICAAGHKALYSDEWGGLPDKKFLSALDPRLGDLRERLYSRAFDATTPAGSLGPEWARRLGLPAGIPIAIGEFDVHYGSIGCGIRVGTLVKVIGTSTCDCALVSSGSRAPDIPGICGIVPGSILPGYHAIEAGQSAVGDIFNWWVEVACGADEAMHARLTAEAARLEPGQSGLLALDWQNGNRTILVDPRLTGLLVGCTLQTTRAEIYRALIEATAFGARMIIERIREYGVPTRRIVCAGGIAEKNPLLMQIYADVTGCTMHVAGSNQACALGAAISAAVLAGAHRDFPAAERAMTRLKRAAYRPDPRRRRVYNRLYTQYRTLHDGFGGVRRRADLSRVMKELLAIQADTRGK